MKRRELFFASIILCLFVVFSLLVEQNLFQHLDLSITVKLQDHISDSFDTGFSLFSLIGSAEIISLFLLFPALVYYKWRSLVIFFSYAFGLFIEVIGKTFLIHSGPPHLFSRYDLGFSLPTGYIHTLHSYPSGHSYRTAFVVYVWFLFLYETAKTRTQKIVAFSATGSFCAIMLISRVSLGEHWTTDVVGGSLLGLGLAVASCAFRETRLSQNIQKKKYASNTS